MIIINFIFLNIKLLKQWLKYFSLITFYIFLFIIKFMFLSSIYNFLSLFNFFLWFQILKIIIPLNYKNHQKKKKIRSFLFNMKNFINEAEEEKDDCYGNDDYGEYDEGRNSFFF